MYIKLNVNEKEPFLKRMKRKEKVLLLILLTLSILLHNQPFLSLKT
jgi:hypothetical protein